MKKLARFIIVSILFVFTFVLLYSFLPSIVWVFGGSFREVSQSVPYVMFGGIASIVVTGVTFATCFDSNFYPSN